MRICQNPGVHRDERRIENPRRRHDDLVCGVAVKCARKLRGLGTHAGREVEQANAGIGKCLLNQIEDWARESKPLTLGQLGDFPA